MGVQHADGSVHVTHCQLDGEGSGEGFGGAGAGCDLEECSRVDRAAPCGDLRVSGGGESAGGSGSSVCVGWLHTNLGCGAYLDAAAAAAAAAAAHSPTAPALWVSVDCVKSARAGACVECFDLRTGAALPFELR
jgi:hypothetical protein